MNVHPVRLLNRLLAIQCRSFPQYLQYSRPYVPPGRGEELETLETIARSQDSMADRISRLIDDLDALPHSGEFPMEFTDMHDLDVDYVVAAAIRYQKQDIEAIQSLVSQAETTPAV